MEAIHEKIIGKYKVVVVQDTDPRSPDENGNDDMFLIYDHRDFGVERKGFDPEDIFLNYYQMGKKLYKKYWFFPVYAYIHGGVVLSVGSHDFPDAQWDVSMRGFALVQRKYWGTQEKALKAAQSLIEEWNEYLSGDVYGFKVIEIPDDPEEDEDDDDFNVVESVWGYSGDSEYCFKEGIAVAEALVEKDKHGQTEIVFDK